MLGRGHKPWPLVWSGLMAEVGISMSRPDKELRERTSSSFLFSPYCPANDLQAVQCRDAHGGACMSAWEANVHV